MHGDWPDAADTGVVDDVVTAVDTESCDDKLVGTGSVVSDQ